MCALLLITSQIEAIRKAGWSAIMFPILIQSSGVMVSIMTSFAATVFDPINKVGDVMGSLRLQHALAAGLMIPFTIAVTLSFLPAEFEFQGLNSTRVVTVYHVTAILLMGVFTGRLHSLISKFSNITDLIFPPYL